MTDETKEIKHNNQRHEQAWNARERTSARARGWPEVVGLTVEAAEGRIKQDMPHARFQVVPPGTFVTMEFDPNRVRLYTDDSNKVARSPQVG